MGDLCNLFLGQHQVLLLFFAILAIRIHEVPKHLMNSYREYCDVCSIWCNNTALLRDRTM